MYKTLLFDMDGTVLDTLGDLTAAVNYTLRHFNEPEHTEDEIRSFVGNGVRKLIARSVPDGFDNPSFEEQLSFYQAYYKEHDRELTKPYDGIVELMKEAKEKGIKIGIVSNKQHPAVVDLSDHFFGDLVDVAVGNKPYGKMKPKPDPDIVFTAMESLSADPSSTVYIGDSDVDAKTAENAGVPCILVSWGFRPKDFLEKQNCIAVVDNTDELIQKLW